MTEEEKDIRQKIDLHYGKTDFSTNKNYVEFSFYACFYEIFNIEDSYWESDLEGSELFDILTYLDILPELSFLKQKYFDQKNHDVEVFHSRNDEQTFAYFDLEKDPTDQNNMFFLGIRCNKTSEDHVYNKLLEIYRKLKTTSPFQYDILNHVLYNKTFRSYFYFYENNYNKYKRRINHH